MAELYRRPTREEIAARIQSAASPAVVPEAAKPDPEPAPPLVTASRCKQCGYLTTAIGHQVMCDD